MAEFLYHGDYKELEHPDSQTTDKDSRDSNPGGAHHAILHAAMFAVADKYNIAALGDVAKNKFEEAIKEDVLDTGYFMDVIEYVYSTTPESNRGLRDLIVFQTQTRGGTIMAVPELNSRLEEIISTTPHFAIDLIQKSLQSASPSRTRCSTCKVELGTGLNCSGCARHGQVQSGWLFDQSRDPNVIRHGPFGNINSDPQTNTVLFGSTNANTHPTTGASGNINRDTQAATDEFGNPNDTHDSTGFSGNPNSWKPVPTLGLR